MKKAGKKKRVSEFATEYTLANAAKKGDIVTKLSFLIMGLGNIVHKQVVKGLMFLGVEVLYIWFLQFINASITGMERTGKGLERTEERL